MDRRKRKGALPEAGIDMIFGAAPGSMVPGAGMGLLLNPFSKTEAEK